MKISVSKMILLCFVYVFSLNTYASGEIELRIREVENGLKKGIQIKGEEMPRMNIMERMKYHQVPSVSVAIINKGKIEWAKTYNLSDADRVTTQTLFQAGSISKPLAAVVALSLVEKNRFNLDSNVNDSLKTWKVAENQYTEKEKVTLRRILSHTAGLSVHGFMGYATSMQPADLPTLTQILNGEQPANSERVEAVNIPGTVFSYSGGGYLVAEKMMEDVTQEKFSQLAHQIIFKPLLMKSSTYELIWPDNAPGDFAAGHDERGEIVAGRWNLLPESTAAGLWTTPSELARFVIEMQNTFSGQSQKIISTAMSKKMLTKQLHSDFGLGFVVNPINEDIIEFSHGGANVGFIADMVGFTHTQQGAVIMTNSINGGRIISEIIRGIADAYHWPDGYSHQYKFVQPVPIDTAIYKKYIGKFGIKTGPKETDPIVILTLSNENDKFNITFPYPTPTSENKTFELTPESETEFFNLEGDFEIIFTPDNNDEFTIVGMKAKRIFS